MSRGNGDRPTTPSDVDFSFAFMQQQLESLPGKVEEPTNPSWQKDVVSSVEHKVIFISGANPDFLFAAAGLLRSHAQRLERIVAGGITSAAILTALADRIDPPQDTIAS